MDHNESNVEPGTETAAGQIEMSSEAAAIEARREVLKRIGIYTAVSAPILMGALKAEKAVAATGPGIPGGGGTGGGGSTVIP
jgi:hypothetical protein